MLNPNMAVIFEFSIFFFKQTLAWGGLTTTTYSDFDVIWCDISIQRDEYIGFHASIK